MITVYSMPACAHCIDLKDYLKEKGIEFKEIDCSVDYESAAYIVDKTKQTSVPITVIENVHGGEKYLIGFQRESFEEFLTLHTQVIY